MWAMVKAANESGSERLKNITTRVISNLMCDYKLVHSVVDNLGVKVRYALCRDAAQLLLQLRWLACAVMGRRLCMWPCVPGGGEAEGHALRGGHGSNAVGVLCTLTRVAPALWRVPPPHPTPDVMCLMSVIDCNFQDSKQPHHQAVVCHRPSPAFVAPQTAASFGGGRRYPWCVALSLGARVCAWCARTFASLSGGAVC
jgi:hypothetical protein